jgi:hypothetical protein
MISDILFESADKIRWYLRELEKCYPAGSEIEIEIQAILEMMDSLRVKLDAPPGATS